MTQVMSKAKYLVAFVVAAVLAMALAGSALAQTVTKDPASEENASITITNAAKGETYAIYKLFDATNSAAQTDGVSDSIAYTGTIPDSLKDYFTADDAGNITATDAAKASDGSLSEDAIAALKAWAEEQEPTLEAECGDGALVFAGLDYGYYVVTTTQGETAISVDSTNPDATIIDKNTTPPVKNLGKEVDDEIVSIGDTVTYTISFQTANYDGEDQIDKYVIEDTLPGFLGNVSVRSIIVDDDADTETTTDQHNVTAQFSSGKITIPWAQNGANLYKNGALITITYSATVTSAAAAGAVGNTNTVTVKAYSGDYVTENGQASDTETIYTYAAALKKVDSNNNALAGASFQVNGLTVEGTPGNYTVVSFDPDSEDAGTIMLCDSEGKLVIRGISNEDTVTAYEVDAPTGYNKLTDGAEMTVFITETATTVTASESQTTTYYDSDGKVVKEYTQGGSYTTTATNTVANEDFKWTEIGSVVNQQGTELPSTGGMGTTILYIVGGIMVVLAAVVLITKRRASKEL